MSHASGTGRCAISWPRGHDQTVRDQRHSAPEGKNRAVVSSLVVVPVSAASQAGEVTRSSITPGRRAVAR